MRFLLAGYFGFGNFGDEAILKYALDVLRFYYPQAQISVISESLYYTKKVYDVNAIYRFDIKSIINAIKNCDSMIFPGGSILQDITSLKSIVYYLFLMFWAVVFKKKLILLSQGIGPVKNLFAQKIMYKILKKAALITLRDEKSYTDLQNHQITCEQTADFLWAFTQKINQTPAKEEVVYGDISCSVEKKKVGIQLRNWKDLSLEKINIMANAIFKSFSPLEYDYKLICLQKNTDEQVLVDLGKAFCALSKDVSLELLAEKDIEKNIEILQSMDYMIAMRFHAGLCTINAEKPLLMLSYDPKTEKFCNELGLKFIDIKEITAENMKEGIAWLKEFNPARTALKTNILVKKSQQNVDYLVKVIQ